VLTEGAWRRPAPTGFTHEAFVFDDDKSFVEGTADFVRAGVTAGEAVLVAVPTDGLEALRAELADIAERVEWVDITVAGRNPARIIPLWRELVETHATAGHAVRSVGQPVYAGRRPAELAETQLYEALVNIAFERVPDFHLRCPYDVREAGAALIDDLSTTHPVVLSGIPVDGEFDPEAAADVFAEPLPPAPADAERWPIAIDELHVLRRAVREAALRHGLSADQADDVALAAHEICKNSVRFAGDGTFAIWAEDDTLLCETTDGGRIDQLLVGRAVPPPLAESGRGLWLANQLCDLVQIRSSPEGTTVRLHAVR